MNEHRRVNAGAALLDERKPGWFRLVSVKDLDMTSAKLCILGQLFRGYLCGTRELRLAGLPEEITLGFEGGYGDDREEADRAKEASALRAEWIRAIEERMDKAS